MELIHKGTYRFNELPNVGDQVTLVNVLAYGPNQPLNVMDREIIGERVDFTLFDITTGQEVAGVHVEVTKRIGEI